MSRLEAPAMSTRPKTGDGWAIEHTAVEDKSGAAAVIRGARQQGLTRWARL
jgi:hypothetical protein